MALTLTVKDRTVFGNKRIVIVDVDFDSSYPSGGETLNASDLGLSSIDFVSPPSSKDGYLFDYDYTNSKLKVFYPVKEVADTLVIDAGTTTVTSTAANGDIISGTPGITRSVGEEVPNGTDLSALTAVRLFVFGC